MAGVGEVAALVVALEIGCVANTTRVASTTSVWNVLILYQQGRQSTPSSYVSRLVRRTNKRFRLLREEEGGASATGGALAAAAAMQGQRQRATPVQTFKTLILAAPLPDPITSCDFPLHYPT